MARAEELVRFEANILPKAAKAVTVKEGGKSENLCALTNAWIKIVVHISNFSPKSIILLDSQLNLSCFFFWFCWPELRLIDKLKPTVNVAFIFKIIN